MNNKGFTVVELIAAFSITMVICIFLFELLLEVKDIFVETSLKTSIQEKNAIISKNIYNLFKDEGNNVTCISNSCTINGKNLQIADEAITISNQKFTMPKDGDKTINIENASITNNTLTNGKYIQVKFKLESSNLSKPYEYNVIYYYK